MNSLKIFRNFFGYIAVTVAIATVVETIHRYDKLTAKVTKTLEIIKYLLNP